MGRGGRRRGRTQRKDFKDSRDDVWKRPKSDTPLDSDNPAPQNPSWLPFVVENPDFEDYYKEQGIVKPEEWDVFMEILRKPLPAAFRVNSNGQFCDDIISKFENDFVESLHAEAIEGGELEAIKPLPWYPKNLAWHSNFSRKQIRKNPTLERFHEFLKLENEVGNITRQEAVSMVPPLFLDVHPDHFILDMCAAPGSKTFQLLEIIHQLSGPGALPNGMVVANDCDFKRSNLLIHQTKRMCTSNLIVTNHEGQQFPGCRLKIDLSKATKEEVCQDLCINQLAFDRVLCDVPCSGDGTLRKAPDIWRRWNPGMGNGLHSLQVILAMRGLSLLKVGGKMIYSTCSMNPIEDEAVVAEILRRCGDSVELLDVSNELPELIRSPGLKKWKVRDRGVWLTSYKDAPRSRRSGLLPSMFPSGKSYKLSGDSNQNTENGEEINCQDGCDGVKDSVVSSGESFEEISDLPLERCIRILPHEQNTGGFFIAVLRKLSPLPELQENPKKQKKSYTKNTESSEKSPTEATRDSSTMEADSENETIVEPSDSAPKADLVEEEPDGNNSIAELCSSADHENVAGEIEDDENVPGEIEDDENIPVEIEEVAGDKGTDPGHSGVKRKIPMQGKWKGFDPVLFLKDEALIDSIKRFYGIDDESFPLTGHLVTRNSDSNCVKRIYYVSKSLKDVLQLNFAVGQQLKIASVGLKMFERQSSREGTTAPCSFRISSEGLPVILPYISKQVLYAPLADFKHLLDRKSIKFHDLVDPHFRKKATDLEMGCCIVILHEGGEPNSVPRKSDSSTIAIGCWRGKASLGVMVTAIDCQELLERLSDRFKGVDANPANENNAEADERQDNGHTVDN